MTTPEHNVMAALDVFECPLDGMQLIEASAGTGKTWNICGLVLRLLLERGLQVQQILVVTFTNAATAELRERIRSRVVDTLGRLRGEGPAGEEPFVDQLLATLRRRGLDDRTMALRLDLALQTFDEASIFTIHGFCQRALGDAPFTAGVPMQLELLHDDTPLRLQVVHDFWRRRIAGGTLAPAVLNHLLERGDTPERHQALLKRQLAKPTSVLRWPAAIDDAAPHDEAALASAFAAAQATWHARRAEVLDTLTQALPRLHAGSYKADTIERSAAAWDTLLAGSDPLAAVADDSKAGDRLDLLASHKLAAKVKKQARSNQKYEPPEHTFFVQAQALIDARRAAQQSLAAARLRLLRELLDQGPAALRDAKRERRVIAFDDMLFNLYTRLTSGQAPGLAAALRQRFPAALIDEFQDTDPLQFAIFERIHREGGCPLFLVGDPKQAIYSFRHADLHTYLHARSLAGSTYTLADNQRSSEPLLTAMNALFGRNPRAFMLDGLVYPPVGFGRKPRPAFDDRSAPRAPLQLWTLPTQPDGRPATKLQATQAALEGCAGEIARLLQAALYGEVQLAGRPLAAGDIAVLVRTHRQGSAMRAALARRGVGSVELSQASLFASPDALELERVLAAVLEPAREPVLRAALATAMLGGDAAGLDALATDEAALLDAVTRFAAYRMLWLQRGVGAMLRRLMQTEGVDARLLARPDGERRLTNLMHLAECLHEAAREAPAPQALLRWLQAQRTQGRSDDASQLRLESDRNLVQIVTIHRAKGLEYPIVFCPFLWDGHAGGGGDRLEGREYHEPGPDGGRAIIDLRSDDEIGDDPCKAIQRQLRLERAGETLRLIYVALTRAVHRCVVVVGPYLAKTSHGDSIKECSRAPLNWLVTGAGMSPSAWLDDGPAPEAIDRAWSALAAAQAPHIGLSPLPRDTATLDPQQPAPESLRAREAPAHIPPAWWIGSYSSLAHGARHDGAAVDHDQRVDEKGASAAPTADDDILHFPRGAAAGDCLHAVFERIDFTAPDGWPAAIDAALRTLPPAAAPEAAAARWPAMVVQMLRDVLHTPLPGGMRLATLPRAQRRVELEFTLPVGQLSAAALTQALHAAGYPSAPLAFGSLQGYLRGFIDLVFEHDGRFHVLDWKSNHLGDTAAHYAGDALERAMGAHGYHLQALLYAAALHRHLQATLPGYDYERHFGGVLYLFVRGVRPGWADGAGRPAGVWAHTPSRAVIERLLDLMAPAETAA